MLEAFKDIVPDISAIGTHSLRSGGATRLSLSLSRSVGTEGENAGNEVDFLI